MGGNLSKTDQESDNENLQRTPQFQILDTLYEVLYGQTNDDGTAHLNRETVTKFKNLYQELRWKQAGEHKYRSNEYKPETEDTKFKKRLRKCIEADICDPAPSEATEAFISVFGEKLHNDGIFVRKTTTISDSKTPVFLICNISSRLEVDVNRVLKYIKEADFDRLVLITLHVKDEHALPQEETKHKLNMQERYRYFKGIVDIAFTQEKGLYSCRMNDNARSEIRRLFDGM